MSSLLGKLKSLMIARVRGTRHYSQETEPPAEKTAAPGPVPEVTEASPRQIELPEVVEAPQADHAPLQTVKPIILQSTSRVEAPRKEGAQTEPLEDDRIVDLLKDDES